ncbi:MAG: hypothetical protein R2932_30710 [Caldilineaceae bacterium]
MLQNRPTLPTAGDDTRPLAGAAPSGPVVYALYFITATLAEATCQGTVLAPRKRRTWFG